MGNNDKVDNRKKNSGCKGNIIIIVKDSRSLSIPWSPRTAFQAPTAWTAMQIWNQRQKHTTHSYSPPLSTTTSNDLPLSIFVLAENHPNTQCPDIRSQPWFKFINTHGANLITVREALNRSCWGNEKEALSWEGLILHQESSNRPQWPRISHRRSRGVSSGI